MLLCLAFWSTFTYLYLVIAVNLDIFIPVNSISLVFTHHLTVFRVGFSGFNTHIKRPTSKSWFTIY